MNGWTVNEYGEPSDVLKVVEQSQPKVKVGEALIEVESAALNFFDILLCQGKYQEKPPFPFTIGAEVSGRVVQIPEGSSLKEGQRVLALPKLPSGGLAEFVAVNEGLIYPIPESMSWNEAASFFMTYHTSFYALHERGNLKDGDVLLVHAGAGGVGSAAIQLGKATGAYVIATAGGQEKTNICKELGADVVVDYTSEDFVQVVKEHTGGKGADVIFDPVGGHVFDRSRKCIGFDGRILVIGFAGGDIPSAPANHMLVKNYSVVGVHWGLFAKLKPEEVRKEHDRLLDLYEDRKIKPLIYREFAFDQVPSALDLLAQRKTWGKLVVNVKTN
ncbi:NADPH:quinone oxidoreductase family protein [Desertibacillus haloalkaliphilus]|uniref:NADPH:quinone oxidoreductase family protein n=1 Tax=Desertibacillus haloalkaliphilus TaxID=1328930 RepID=UPI001C255015|nr:NADPH:quinone oxidoreductase family protein [Desertibacillus haloalkaliphilus]MBU8907916.1 NADPH:quinone oxidoreductase family protein [Desertibacillus haloalkaliphilus]